MTTDGKSPAQYAERSEAPDIDVELSAHGFGLRVAKDDPTILLCQVVDFAGVQVCIYSKMTVADADELIEDIHRAQAVSKKVAEEQGGSHDD